TSLMHFDGGFSTVNNLKNDWEVFEGPQVDFNKALAANDFTPGGGPDWHDFGSVGGDDRTLTASPGAEFNRALWTASDTVPFIDISIHYLGALANATEGVPFQGFDTQLKSFGTAGRIRIEYTYNPIPSPGSGLAFVPFLRRRRR
ncbi:MAG TPA: hypothetical protein PKU91_05290, partial [Phycisphaerales bacterium]|nr:hypothetical protein [Phycisphaerales bacterium]